MKTFQPLIQNLNDYPVVRDFRRAFAETTRMPVTLRGMETVERPYRGQTRENSFCALLSECAGTCASCQGTYEQLTAAAQEGVKTLTCPFGLLEAAAPLRIGTKTVGFLQTGQVLRHPPTEDEFEHVTRQVEQSGVQLDRDTLRAAYQRTTIVPDAAFQSATKLLVIFSDYLSLLGNQLITQMAQNEPLLIRRAKQFIIEHLEESLPLSRVATAVHTSPFHLCKLFRKQSSMNFKEYVSRLRVERAKSLLLNPQTRISEACFDSGFNSIATFNRLFHTLVGITPSEYRAGLPHPTEGLMVPKPPCKTPRKNGEVRDRLPRRLRFRPPSIGFRAS